MSDYSLRLLIVDDEVDLCNTLKSILTMQSYNVSTANNREEAVELINKHRFEVAIIDLKLGDISGIDIIKEIKTVSPYTECIVPMLST